MSADAVGKKVAMDINNITTGWIMTNLNIQLVFEEHQAGGGQDAGAGEPGYLIYISFGFNS
jgi:hypothetical protein